MDENHVLAAVFLEKLGRTEIPAEEVLASLTALVEQGRQAWPGISVDAVRLVRCAAERMRSGAELPRAIEALHAPGLYIACACEAGDEVAMAAVDARFLADRGMLPRLIGDPSLADEVRQLVRTKLFVAEAGQRPKICEYRAQGDLGTFLRVLMVREALSLRRKGWREVGLETGDGAHAGEDVAPADPELLFLRRTYEPEFRRGFHDAALSLTSEERNLLRFHYIDRLNIDQIGAIYGIHRVSAARRLTKVRAALVAETRRLLADRLRLEKGELESVLRALESQVDISLRQVLREEHAAP